MKFYTETHQHYWGIDFHTNTMHLCILNSSFKIILHTNVSARPKLFLKVINPFRDDLVMYWLADRCIQEEIKFFLGHALYMKAIHGGKAKSNKIDSEKIARLIQGGIFPLAYVYPPELRPTWNLLRRRRTLVRMRSEMLAHVKLTHYQYYAEFFQKNINKKGNREGIAEKFWDSTI